MRVLRTFYNGAVSKSSGVTVRETPVAKTASAKTGGFAVVRANADSHLRAMLLGHSVTMQVSGGELVVGRWQRVLCGEMDGPRTRTIRAQVQGISG